MIRLTTIAAAISLMAAACQSTPDAGTSRGDGAYRYVLGYDDATGAAIFGGTHEVVTITERGKAEAIDSANSTSRLHPALRGTYAKYDASLTGGETNWDVFASNWWPQSKNGTAWRWQSGANQDYNDHSKPDQMSPMEKYDLLAFPGQKRDIAEVEHCEYRDYATNGADKCKKITRPAITVPGPATEWEMKNQGQYQQFDPENWWGHCNGWASYATAEPDGWPRRDVRVKLSAGKIVECTDASDTSCVLFKMADIEALMTELYFSDQATFTGRRCNTEPDKIERDEFGRPTDPACRDLNAGSLHIAMTGLLSRGAENLVTNEQGQKPAFVIDHNYDYEIWNFPLVAYEIRSQEEVSREEATKLVGDTGSDYQFNPDAQKFVVVRSTYSMVSDSVPPHQLALPADQRTIPLHDVDLNYVLELSATDTILGGEWIQDPKTSWGEDSKELHPDFAWMALNPVGYGENNDDTGGNSDNPFVSYPIVKAILQCANDATTCSAAPAPTGSMCENQCGKGPFSENGKSCYCDDACTTYNDCCDGFAEACTEPEPEPTGPSCAGHCDSTSSVPGSSPACYCDSKCEGYGDCCDDKQAVCN